MGDLTEFFGFSGFHRTINTGEFHFLEHRSGYAAEDEFTQSGVAVGAHHDDIGEEMIAAYRELSRKLGVGDASVAVRALLRRISRRQALPGSRSAF